MREQGQRYETQHLRSLGMALDSRLLLSDGPRLLSLQLPFVVLLLLVAVVILALDRIWVALEIRKPS